ncbi:MAG: glycosyltransferase [Flavobacterium sp.]|nr:MAG: glycosyltransferase [Flavobacterium sp.]
MRVIQITPAYKPAYIYGGPTVSVALLCEGLVKLKLNLIVYTTTANGEEDFVTDESVTQVEDVSVIYFKRLWKGQLHLSLSLLKELFLKTSKRDILHIHSWWNATAILSTLLGILRRNKVVLSPRGMLTKYSLTNRQRLLKKLFHVLLGKWMLNQCLIHVTSEKEKQDVLNFINHERIVVIPNIADNTFLINTERIFKNEISPVFKLLFFSRIDKKKGIETLFFAFNKLKIPWHLTIAGSGNHKYIQYLKSEVTRLKLQEKVNWIGFVNVKDKVKVFHVHDLLVLFSHNENFANVVIESLSSGLPVALSDSVGLADFVIKFGLGWVSKNEVPTITSLIETAFQDVKKRSLINKIAPTIIKQHFNQESISARYLAMYMNYEC